MPAKFLTRLLLTLSNTAIANTICANGSSTDADGDGWGWGWGNDQSCLVADDSSGGGDQLTDTSGCDYSNASGGWNNTTALPGQALQE